jgi:hypothetical protein
MAWSNVEDGNKWQNMEINVGKVRKICQNEKMIGKKYQWKQHIEIPNMVKMKSDVKIGERWKEIPKYEIVGMQQNVTKIQKVQ